MIAPVMAQGWRPDTEMGRPGPPRRRASGPRATRAVRDQGLPVLSAGRTPHTPLEQWNFTISGEVGELRRWTWDEFRWSPTRIREHVYYYV